MPAVTAIDLLGGEKTLRRKMTSSLTVVEAVRAGLPYASLEAVMKALGLSRAQASGVLSVPIRTLIRRKQQRRLASTESDRLYRLARVAARAVEVFESPQKAASWLRGRIPALGGTVPIDLLDTDAGAQQVEEVLGRVEWGMFS